MLDLIAMAEQILTAPQQTQQPIINYEDDTDDEGLEWWQK